MKTKDELPFTEARLPTTKPADTDADKQLPSTRGAKPRVVFARYDRLPLLGIPERVDQGGVEVLQATAHDLYYEGGRGATARRLLCREAAVALGQYRYRSALANIVLEPVLHGRGDPKLLDAVERQVSGAQRRMLDALDRLARIDIGPTPRVSVTAHGNTQVNVTGAEQ